MLKNRIIGVVLVKNGIAVQSVQFKHFLPLGKPEIAIRYFDRWGVDEIVVLNIDGATTDKPFSAEQVRLFANQCNVPLAIGGGLRDLSSIKKMIRSGADKVVLNNSVFFYPDLITQSSDLFGQQCIIVSLDAKEIAPQQSMVYYKNGKINSHCSVENLAKQVEGLGAGEILLTSIDQDGTQQGYDLRMMSSVIQNVNIPIIICGGAGHPKHAFEAIVLGASAIAVGNYFHFMEHSIIVFKKYLAAQQLPIRHDSYVTYNNHLIDDLGRITKHDDTILNNLRFKYISEEVI